MIAFCPRCGAQFPFEIAWEFARASVRCRDCGLAPAEPPPMLAPSQSDVEYPLDGWPMTSRVAATAVLVEAEIPYRWETGLVLVVPAVADERVDRLLQNVEGGDGRQVDDVAVEIPDDEADGGEEAQAAMADLFVTADRLQHAPWDTGMAEQLAKLAATVASCLPPYGIERRVWDRVQSLVAALLANLEESANDDAVRGNAGALRDLLRNYV